MLLNHQISVQLKFHSFRFYKTATLYFSALQQIQRSKVTQVYIQAEMGSGLACNYYNI